MHTRETFRLERRVRRKQPNQRGFEFGAFPSISSGFVQQLLDLTQRFHAQAGLVFRRERNDRVKVSGCHASNRKKRYSHDKTHDCHR